MTIICNWWGRGWWGWGKGEDDEGEGEEVELEEEEEQKEDEEVKDQRCWMDVFNNPWKEKEIWLPLSLTCTQHYTVHKNANKNGWKK